MRKQQKHPKLSRSERFRRELENDAAKFANWSVEELGHKYVRDVEYYSRWRNYRTDIDDFDAA